MTNHSFQKGRRLMEQAIFLALFSLVSCEPETQVQPGSSVSTEAQHKAGSLYFEIAASRPEVQQFGLSGSEFSNITGELGTQIKVVPADLIRPSGAPIKGDLILELIELPYAEDMVVHQVSTLAGDQAFSTGGTIHIRLMNEGEELVLAEGKSMEVSIPCRSMGTMEIYHGREDSLGNISWEGTGKIIQHSGQGANHLPTKPGETLSDRQLAEELVRERDALGIEGTALDKFPSGNRDQTAIAAAKRRGAVHTYSINQSIKVPFLGWITCGFPLQRTLPVDLTFVLPSKPSGPVLLWAVAPDKAFVQGPVSIQEAGKAIKLNLFETQALRLLAITRDEAGAVLLSSQEVSLAAGQQNAVSLPFKVVNEQVLRHYLGQPLAL